MLFVEYIEGVGEKLFGGGLFCREFSDEVGRVAGDSRNDALD